jgi:Ca2+-binding EF-hand superfamily protein
LKSNSIESLVSSSIQFYYFFVGKIETQTVINEMLDECTGPLNFTMFLSLFADKIGSTDPETVIHSAYSTFDRNETGKVECKSLKRLLTTTGDRFTKDEVKIILFFLFIFFLFLNLI